MSIARAVAGLIGTGETGDSPDRAYRLQADAYVPDGVRRIARGQLRDARGPRPYERSRSASSA